MLSTPLNPIHHAGPVLASFAVAAICLTTACSPTERTEGVRTVPDSLRQFIIIDIDTLRADHLGCYGYPRETSPNLDRLAEEAFLFEWAFAQAPNTPPSQASILTGLYPTTHGFIGDKDRLPDEVQTLAEVLSANGFSTAGFHDGGYLRQIFNIGQGFDLYRGFGGQGLDKSLPEAIRWLRDHRDDDFLLFLHTYDTHSPYGISERHNELFTHGIDAPTPGFAPSAEYMEKVRLSVWTDDQITLAENDLEYARALYDSDIRFVDDWVGRLMTVVRQLGLDQKATIVVISDHGEEFQEHGSVLHEKLYRTVTHVPLIIRLPGGAPAARIEHPVEALDLMPTLLDLAGIDVPGAVQGDSLVPLMRGLSVSSPGPAFAESPFFGHRRSIVDGDLHLLHTRSSGANELYRYASDRSEQNDISGNRSADVERLENLLHEWQSRVETDKVRAESTAQELDEKTEQQLRELGYIQ